MLLADLRRLLEAERAAGGRYPATLLDRLLDDDRWPCKANLATRLHDLDELVGDIATQSVYVTVPNPLNGLMTGITLEPADPDRHADLLHGWMNQPHVVPWWEIDRSPAGVRAYLEAQLALPHLDPWVARDDGRPVGYVETYRAAADPLAAVLPGDRRRPGLARPGRPSRAASAPAWPGAWAGPSWPGSWPTPTPTGWCASPTPATSA